MIDTVLRVVTPEGISFDLHPAGPLPRLAAFLLDSVFQVVALAILASVAVSIGLNGDWVFFLLGFAVVWFYMVSFEQIMGGRTPGKRILGLQVVRRDGTPPRFGASLLRNLLRFADYFVALGLLVPLFSRGFRRLGDLAAGTLVIYGPEKVAAWNNRQVFQHVAAQPPQRILDTTAAVAALEFGRRSASLPPGLRQELAELALPVYVLDPENVSNAAASLMSIAAWYAGDRP